MPFGWGSSKEEPPAKDFSSTDEATFTTSDADLSAAVMPSSAGGSAAGEMQQFGLALQQQLLVQQVITNLTDTAFEKCIAGKPSDALSGREAACVHSCVNKWMDTNEFMMGRMQRKQQQGGGGYS